MAQNTLGAFWKEHQDEGPLRSWYAEASAADWKTTANLKTNDRIDAQTI
jgi:mRNA-degrading endonuclease HigB of HigAB toxin-antitoxin module